MFYDILPDMGEVRGCKTRIHLYKVAQQVFYDSQRKLMLKNVSGVVFVADSRIMRAEANQIALDQLREELAAMGDSLDLIPFVIQYNRRDLPEIATVGELRQLLNPLGVPDFEAIASTGVGVFDTLKAITKLILTEMKKGGW
jgi:signal recognition particle receptor subunit beta